MRVQTKVTVAIAPLVTALLVAMGAWYYFQARESVFQHTYDTLGVLLLETVENDLGKRVKLMSRTKTDGIDFFVSAYQKEALQAMGEREFQQHGDLFVFNQKGELLLGTNARLTEGVPQFLEQVTPPPVASNRKYEQGLLLLGGERYLYAATKFQPWGWKVVLILHGHGVYSAINNLFWGVSLSIVLSVVFAITGIHWLTNRFLVQHVLLLKNAAFDISRQVSVEKIPIDSHDELGELARSIESMSFTLQQQHEKEKQMQGDLRELNEELRVSNDRLEGLNKELEQKVRERTRSIESINTVLRENLQSLQQQLEEADTKRQKLVVDMSEIVSGKSDLAALNAQLVDKLRTSSEECEILREQIQSYAAMIETSDTGLKI